MTKYLITMGLLSVVEMSGFILVFALMDGIREINLQLYNREFKRLGFNLLLIVLFLALGTCINTYKGKLRREHYDKFKPISSNVYFENIDNEVDYAY